MAQINIKFDNKKIISILINEIGILETFKLIYETWQEMEEKKTSTQTTPVTDSESDYTVGSGTVNKYPFDANSFIKYNIPPHITDQLFVNTSDAIPHGEQRKMFNALLNSELEDGKPEACIKCTNNTCSIHCDHLINFMQYRNSKFRDDM